jgi:prevent-host-death family protein
MINTPVSISELRKNFDNIIRDLKSGETILITRYGQAIAKIIPVSDSIDDKLQSVVEAGLADWNGRKFKPDAPAVVNRGDTQVAGLVSSDRDFKPES